MTTRTIEVSIKVRSDEWGTDHVFRWARLNSKGQWTSGVYGPGYREHRNEATARANLADWLRSQATKLEAMPVIEAADLPEILENMVDPE